MDQAKSLNRKVLKVSEQRKLVSMLKKHGLTATKKLCEQEGVTHSLAFLSKLATANGIVFTRGRRAK